MRLSIYIHQDRLDVVKMYGDLSQFVNRILEAYEQGLIDIENKPECESREGACRCEINITNDNYISLLNLYGVKSKRISLRRLLYWFIDNEMYNELGWEPVNDYVSNTNYKLNKYVDKVIVELTRLQIFCEQEGLTHCVNILEDARNSILECKR